jgi:hypothetical protein
MILTPSTQLEDRMEIRSGGVPMLIWFFHMLVWYLVIVPVFLLVIVALLRMINDDWLSES